MKKQTTMAVGSAIVTLIIAVFSLPLGMLAFILDFTGELLLCLAVSLGLMGEWFTAKRRLSPVLKAFFGAIIIIGLIILIFCFGKTSLILTMFTQFPVYVTIFLVMCGLWTLIKHRSPVFGVSFILSGIMILYFYGMGQGIGIEAYILIGLIILGLVIAKRKNLSFNVLQQQKKRNSRRSGRG